MVATPIYELDLGNDFDSFCLIIKFTHFFGYFTKRGRQFRDIFPFSLLRILKNLFSCEWLQSTVSDTYLFAKLSAFSKSR